MSDQSIKQGYPWAFEAEFTGEIFPNTASFRCQLRASLDGPVLLDLTNEVARLSDSVLRIDLSETQTGLLPQGEVFFDIARTDTDPPMHTNATFAVYVTRTITRLP